MDEHLDSRRGLVWFLADLSLDKAFLSHAVRSLHSFWGISNPLPSRGFFDQWIDQGSVRKDGPKHHLNSIRIK